jgi:hypothetical protein
MDGMIITTIVSGEMPMKSAKGLSANVNGLNGNGSVWSGRERKQTGDRRNQSESGVLPAGIRVNRSAARKSGGKGVRICEPPVV